MLVGFQDLVATKEKVIYLLVNVVPPENCSDSHCLQLTLLLGYHADPLHTPTSKMKVARTLIGEAGLGTRLCM